MGLVVLVCFFLSGASGLIFEVVWTRELGLVFGSTTLAMSTVLGAFMGGLALGSHLAGRLVARVRDPLRAYALCEAGVGAYALCIPLLLPHYPALSGLLFRLVGERPAPLTLLRFLAAALLLLVPTTLMGATLPLLSQFLVRHRGARGAAGASVQAGTLMTLNTAGAVAGTFAGGFLLLPLCGVRETNLVAASINLSLAAVVLLGGGRLRAPASRAAGALGRAIALGDATARGDGGEAGEGRVVSAGADPAGADPASADPAGADPAGADPAGADPADGDPAGADPAAEEEAPLDAAAEAARPRRLAVACYALSGAVAMVYQVLWTRALAIVLGSSVYSFTLILLAFLVGLAGGAAVATRLLPRLRRPVLALGLCHLLTLVMALGSYLIIDKLPRLFLSILRGGSFSVDGLIASQFLLAALAVLPATLAMGGVMPLTMRIYTRSSAALGRDVGVAYALNTLGAITGSVAAGFFVLPGLGLQRGLLGCAALTLCLSLLLLHRSERRRLAFALGTVATVGTALFIALSPRWSLEHFSAGLFRVSIANDIIKNDSWPVPKLLYYKDGISTTVSVEQWQRSLALKNNGKVDASNADDMATQIRVGLMPLLFHPQALDRPPRVAVIGYGSGVTAGAVTQFPIAHADVVELEPAVVEAGDRFFSAYSHRPSQDPRVRVLIEDGRNFLARPGAPYDVIVSEPSNPWITGVSSLFTVDYWRLARARLTDDGVFCQWAQLYELSQTNIKTLLRSFTSVFPYTYAFSADDLSSDVILVASKRPLPLDLQRLGRNFTGPAALRAELGRAGVSGVEDLVGDLLLAPDELAALGAGAPINTDDNALIEFAAPRDLLGFMHHDPYIQQVYGAEWPYGRFERYLSGHGSPFIDGDGGRAGSYARLGRALLAHGKLPAARRLHRRALGVGGGPATAHLGRLLSLLGPREPTDFELPLTDSGGPAGVGGLEPPRAPPSMPRAEAERLVVTYAEILAQVGERRWAHALRVMRPWPMRYIEAMGPDLRLLLGYLLYKCDLPEEAAQHLRPLLDEPGYAERRPALRYYLGRAEFFGAKARAGVARLEEYAGPTGAPGGPQR